MLKKALIGIAVVAASSAAALANGGSFAPAPASNCVGAFYVGAAVSRDVVGFDTSVNNYDTSYYNYNVANQYVDYTSADNHSFDWNADGIDGQLFAGYGMVFQDHYTLAAEIFGSISSAKGDRDLYGTAYNYGSAGQVYSSSTYNDSATVKLKHTIGIALLPGFKISDSTTLYGRVGYVDSEFDLSDSGVGTYSANGNTASTTSAALGYWPINADKDKGGLQLGLGAQTMVTSNVGVRLEWTWERYGDVNFATSGTKASIVNSNSADTLTSNVELGNPTVDTVNLGVFYAFNA